MASTTLRPRNPRKLAKLRMIAGLTQPALATKLHLSLSHIQKLERGARGASPTSAKNIARFFGTEISELFTVVDRKRRLPNERKAS